MYRAASFMRRQNVQAALAEINRVLGFKLALECLELRFCFYLGLEDYRAALCDVQAILTLSPDYRMFEGRVAAYQLRTLVREHVGNWTTADCWMQLLNCPEAAMKSLQLARQHASTEHERLVYEGWILYDTGHCEEGLRKAEESIKINRSFEAFFLKAYALADSSQDPSCSVSVVSLLEDALKCPSDRLRKGQNIAHYSFGLCERTLHIVTALSWSEWAHHKLGHVYNGAATKGEVGMSLKRHECTNTLVLKILFARHLTILEVYVDSGKLDLAADCYINALKIRHTRAHQGLARVHFLRNDKAAAYEEMTKLIEKARNNASAYEKRSEYCDRELAKADLEMVTKLDPLRVYPYKYRAAVLMDNRKEKEAIAELSRALHSKQTFTFYT
ncbi:hypothetical protein GH714_025764 [Hevea brasiliensis]|uniref:Uncharacterized protein n=1 Tax=Hevea brasiliensis TaxID=3981 RepID=A0A6A6NJ85_HEVBR|nr:hypothetical protein GH714_025764 [Hevea brasiliensis]